MTVVVIGTGNYLVWKVRKTVYQLMWFLISVPPATRFGGYLNASFISFYFCSLACILIKLAAPIRAQIVVNPLGGTFLYQLAYHVGGGPPFIFCFYGYLLVHVC